MHNKKYLTIGLIGINCIGVLCLIYCAWLYLSHSTYVVNSQAMLPMENWERAGMMLTAGMIPMLIANILAFLFVKKEHAAMKRLFFFIPSILELIFVLHYWIAS